MMSPGMRWTEEELRKEIERLRARISQASRSASATSQAAVAYLKQVLKDRSDDLAVLRRRRLH